jgi:predicted enzyme related to lactoylglutathione lyase
MSNDVTNAVHWFEIPVNDFERATKFYEEVLDTKMTPFPGDAPMNVFARERGIGGCIVQRPQSKPSAEGTTVYLNAEGKLDASIKRAEKLGAKITVPRTEIPGGFGYFACLIDSEGNHVGLHSQQF